eukprot:8448472-Prorocentrum_lima.AAC.1
MDETIARVDRDLSDRQGLEVTATSGELNTDVYFEISLRDRIPFFQLIFSDGYVLNSTNKRVQGPIDSKQSGCQE